MSAIILFAAGVATVPQLGQAAPATAAPAVHAPRVTDPGTAPSPLPPKEVFTEDFESPRPNDLPVRIDEYVGKNGQRYTADQSWLWNCNGWVASQSDPAGGDTAVADQVDDCNGHPAGVTPGHGATGEVAWNHVRALAGALGMLHNPQDALTNHAVSAYTNGPHNQGNITSDEDLEFSTDPDHPIELSATNRFLNLSVNLAEQNCPKANHAELMFYVAGEPVTSAAIDPCTGTGNVTVLGDANTIGTFTGNTPVLVTGSAVGLEMRNSQESGDGNDHAFDDITLLDVTPQLSMAFADSTVQAGDTTTLTYTITNTTDWLAKNGWSFTNDLPPGLVLASEPTASPDCGGTPEGTIGESTVTMTGNLAAGEDNSTCTITVEVTSDVAGTYTNDDSTITDSAGLNPITGDTVTFTAAPVPPETTTDLTVSPNPQVRGRPVILAAHVTCTAGTPTGTVDFLADGTSLGTAPLRGGAAQLTVTGLRRGRHDVVAAFDGSQDCPASRSAPVTVIITPRRPSVHPRPPVHRPPSIHLRPPTVHVTG